jgi:hypothetical protein
VARLHLLPKEDILFPPWELWRETNQVVEKLKNVSKAL